MTEIIERHNITYGCGCIHELVLDVAAFWKPSGNNQDCNDHKEKII